VQYGSDSTIPASAWGDFVDPYVVWEPVRNAVGHIIDFIYVDANTVACASHRCSRDTLIGSAVSDVVPAPLAGGLVETARQVVDTQQLLALRDFAYAPEPYGDLDVLYDVRVVPLDAVVGFTWRVATAQRAEAVALAESERRYRMLAEHASDIVYQTDADEHFVWISPSMRRVLGWDTNALLGTSPIDLVPVEWQAAARASSQSVLQGGRVDAIEGQFLTADGGTHWMLVHAKAVTDQAGNVTGKVVGLRDIQAEVETRERLVESEQRFRLLAENASDEVFLITGDGLIEWASPTVSGANALVGSTPWDFVHPDDRATASQLLVEAAGGGDVRGPFKFRVLNHLGEWEWASATGHGIATPGHPGRVVVALRDVDEEVKAHEQLQESESRYRLLVENATDAVAHSRDGLILWVSPGVTDMLGWTTDQWVGRRVEDFVHPDDAHLIAATRHRLVVSTPTTIRFRMRSDDGRYHWIETHVRPYVDQFGHTDGVAVSFRVVDTEVAAERELERRARYDELTGLLNRKEALDRLNALRDRPPAVGREIAVLFCDIDRFKSINDSFGHAAGDELLRVTADRLRANTRQHDLIARLGGDELLVVLDGVHDLPEATRVAEKLRRRVSDPVPFGNLNIVATLSVGVTLAYPGESEDSVIARADAALYEAKHSGRDQVVSFTARR
jgi:diguanylate cyclase (GGDEF)-like protein/PAS domain S-box-containing protein